MNFSNLHISVKILLAGVAGGAYALAVNPTVLAFVPEPYRTIAAVFISGAIPAGVALNIDPKKVSPSPQPSPAGGEGVKDATVGGLPK